MNPFLWRVITWTTFPVHDPPVAWRSWRGTGGVAGVEVNAGLLVQLSSAEVWRFDATNLPQFEPIGDGR